LSVRTTGEEEEKTNTETEDLRDRHKRQWI
jgi:hypothetical protein